ncbi:hypothetical protein F4779DRAFT_507968 [Xylariaceae sp. FL0662B]|nr:hypothetical protein F4779DRAFT_507968 [Xylariaceae sp. FL0662B]
MRFASFIAAGLFAVANAQDTTALTGTAVSSAVDSAIGSASEAIASATSAAASATVSIDPAQSSAAAAIQSCIDACGDNGVECTSKCIAVPNPDTQAVNATTDCVAKCPQGNGTASDNEAYGECVQGCIGQYYFTTTGAPGSQTTGSAGASGSGSATPSVTAVESTITSDGSTLVTTMSSTLAPSETDSAGAAETTSSAAGADMLFAPIGSGVGLVGFLGALLAL